MDIRDIYNGAISGLYGTFNPAANPAVRVIQDGMFARPAVNGNPISLKDILEFAMSNPTIDAVDRGGRAGYYQGLNDMFDEAFGQKLGPAAGRVYGVSARLQDRPLWEYDRNTYAGTRKGANAARYGSTQGPTGY